MLAYQLSQMNKQTFCILLSATFIFSVFGEVTPFEKNGKWGLIETTKNKVVAKPNYSSIKNAPYNNNTFIVSKDLVDKDNGKVRRKFGIIDYKGKELYPTICDSIIKAHSGYIILSYEIPITHKQSECTLYYLPSVTLVDTSLNKLKTIPGVFRKSLSSGYVITPVVEYGSYNRYNPNTKKYYNSNFEFIGEYIELCQRFFIVSKDQEKLLYDLETEKPLTSINSCERQKPPFVLISNDNKWGYINEDTGEYLLPAYQYYRGNSGEYFNSDGTRLDSGSLILYNQNDEDILLLTPASGHANKGKLVKIDNSEYQFVPAGKGNKVKYGGEDCDEVRVLPCDYYCIVRQGDAWGLFRNRKRINNYQWSEPISDVKDGFAVIEDDEGTRIYSLEGQFIVKMPQSIISDITFNDELIYNKSGVYSIPERKWIVPLGKYSGEIKKFSYNLFYVETAAHTYHLINRRGIVVNTLTNISGFGFGFDDYFREVYSTNGKMGLIDKDSGRWLAQCKYENDYVYGSGEGRNKRIALSVRSDTGETVFIMTLAGKQIASRFFRFGTSKRLIERFGEEYLYQWFH